MDRSETRQIEKMSQQCFICLQKEAKYSCPRCNIAYCGLQCYQSPSHSQCSESFYKDWIHTELVSSGGGASNPQKTLDILKRSRDQAENEDPLDSDDDEDLSVRLEGIDLDDADQLWSILTPAERKDFQSKLDSGELYKLVPSEEKIHSQVWWEVHHEKKKIQELDNEDVEVALHPDLPKIMNIVDIDTSKSSPLVKCNLMNVLFAYVIVYRQLSWQASKAEKDAFEFLSLVLESSTNLANDETFATAEAAIVSAQTRATQSKNFTPDHVKSGRSDVGQIVKGPGGNYNDSIYCLAALSDLHQITNQVLNNYQKNEILSRKRCKMIVKKIEYFMSLVSQNHHRF